MEESVILISVPTQQYPNPVALTFNMSEHTINFFRAHLHEWKLYKHKRKECPPYSVMSSSMRHSYWNLGIEGAHLEYMYVVQDQAKM